MEQNKHSSKCRYNDESKVLYALMELADDKYALMSATEVAKFDKLLDYAQNEDNEISCDFDVNDNEPYKIVYGGMMLNKTRYNESEIEFAWLEASNTIRENLGCALLDVDSENDGKFIASTIDGIKFYPGKAVSEVWIPFVALMKTHHTLHDSESSISMFPCLSDCFIWEMMVNKPFLFACRETVEIEGLTKENWENYISEELVEKAYSVADLLVEE